MWIGFVIVAAFLNAVMDVTENETFYSSKLRDWNKSFWYKRESWDKAKKVFGWKADAWHIAKSLMIISFAFAIVFYKPIAGWYDILIMGAAWNITFNISYWFFKK